MILVVRVKDHTPCLVAEDRLMVVDGVLCGVVHPLKNIVEAEVEEYLQACTVEAVDLVE